MLISSPCKTLGGGWGSPIGEGAVRLRLLSQGCFPVFHSSQRTHSWTHSFSNFRVLCMSVYTEVKKDLKHHMMRANKQKVFCMQKIWKTQACSADPHFGRAISLWLRVVQLMGIHEVLSEAWSTLILKRERFSWDTDHNSNSINASTATGQPCIALRHLIDILHHTKRLTEEPPINKKSQGCAFASWALSPWTGWDTHLSQKPRPCAGHPAAISTAAEYLI